MYYLKWLLKINQTGLIPKTFVFLEFFLIVLFFTTKLFSSETYDLYDIAFESLIIVFSIYMIFNVIIYNVEYTNIMNKIGKNVFFEKSYSISNKYFLEKEKKELPTMYIYFIIIISLLFIEYYDISNGFQLDVVTNNLYFIFLFILLNIVLSNDKFFKMKEITSIELKNNQKTNIENYVFEIEEQLNLFSNSSLFKQRVINAVSLIKNIYLINLNTLERLDFDMKAKVMIKNKNKLIEEQIIQILYSMIEYNNNKNEEILNNIQKNIDIINSLRN